MSTCNKCEEKEEYSSNCCQYDTDQIIYRLNSIDFSGLSALGIGRGDNLTLILEQLGRVILNMNPTYIESFGYNQKTLPELIEFIFLEINNLKIVNNNQSELIADLNDKIIVLTERVNKIEKPEIVDTRGLGFTKFDKINTVLQKIADNG